MAVYLFDTSALVRRYDASEPGSAIVRDLCRPEHGHTLLIARVTPVEIGSAFNRKLRLGTLSRTQFERSWRLFEMDRRDQYRVLAFDEETCERAERLTFMHPIRALDALQIATALRASQFSGDGFGGLRFCTADRSQAAAAGREGLAVELIA